VGAEVIDHRMRYSREYQEYLAERNTVALQVTKQPR
jgi:hypothetical protein